MFTKEDLLKLKKAELVATATQAGADLTQATTKEQIADKILEKLGQQQLPKSEEKPLPPKKPQIVDNEGARKYLQELKDDGVDVVLDEDVVTIRYHGRETCLNINQATDVIKRTVGRFMVDLPRPAEPVNAR